MTLRPGRAAWLLLACPLGQACSPLVFELTPQGDTHHQDTDPNASTGAEPTTGTTAPDPSGPSDGPGPGGPDGPDSDGFDCNDGFPGPDESDIDCGGPCPPCKPGSHCESPRDCEQGECFAGTCTSPQCKDVTDCPPVGPCEIQNCLPSGVCQPEPRKDSEPCDDGDLCTFKEMCLGGKCTPLGQTDCSGLAGPCRDGVCNPVTGNCAVEWLFEGEPCEDGDKCTVGEQCSAGECVAPPPGPPLLFTDFSLAGGWTAQPPWQIGPAIASKCAIPQAEDPGEDHSPSADNHVAGTMIGGCLPTDPFPEACLESPPIDTLKYPGELRLEFFDILSNTGKGMQARIDVFFPDKQSWIPLVTIDDAIFVPDWLPHSEDLTPFKSPELRIRFCQRSDTPSPPVGGWTVDDLSIGPPGCF